MVVKTSNRQRNILKGISVLIVIVALMLQVEYVTIDYLYEYRFGLMVLGYGILLVSSK